MTGSRDVVDFANQMRIVLERHISKRDSGSNDVENIARASIAINTALASASAGDLSFLLRAVSELLRLGPADIRRYLHNSRIMDRLSPWVRAKLGGAF